VTALRIILSRLRGLFFRTSADSELETELRSHIEALTEENIRHGMGPREAAQAARREFGGVEQTKEVYRRQRGLPFLETLLQDVRFGLRLLFKDAGLSAVIIAILAIGIGCGTALYSLIDACLVHTIEQRYPVGKRWEVVRAYLPGQQRFVNLLSAAEIREVQQLTDVFESVGAIHGDGFNLSFGEYPERIGGTHVSANAIAMIGVKPLLGRTFSEAEDRPGGPRVALLSYELWTRKFSSDPNILGRVIQLSSVSYTVVGVMPPYYGLWGGEVWIPLQLDWANPNRSDRQNWIVAVLRKGVTEKQANARLLALSRELEQQYGSTSPEYRDWALSTWNISELVLGGVKPAFLILAGAVGLLLLIVCANVAILLLARATSRRRELALRLVLGAGHGRVLRQILTESLLLSSAGGVLGLCLAKACLPALVHLIPRVWLTAPAEWIRVNSTALGVACGITIAVGILFGLAPAVHGSRQNFSESLKEGGTRVRGDAGGRPLRKFLVVMEIALSMVVLAGAALMTQSYRRLEGVDLGFRPEHMLGLQISLPATKYPGAAQIIGFFDRAVHTFASLPGVEGAAVVSGRPLGERTSDLTSRDFTIEGRPAEDARAAENAYFRVASPDYFRTMGMRLIQGRFLSERDGPDAPSTAVINETMARLYWPAGDAVGHRLRVGAQYGRPEAYASTTPQETTMTIVGVVSDLRQVRAIEAPVRAEFYAPLAQQTDPPRIMAALLRSTLEPAALTSAVRGALATIDSEQPIYSVDTMEQMVADSFGPKRLTLFLLLFLASVALVLAALGLYATVAYSVGQRRQEIGVRVAVGASRSHILRLVVSEGARLGMYGVIAGVVATLALTRLMQSVLYQVSSSDPLTLAGTALALVGVALMASYLPARRATRVDPTIALRGE
jgi:putative ABC transport system permease protein